MDETDAGQIQISDVSSAAHPAVEEAAILYANGQDAMALNALEAAIDEGASGAAADQLWPMLFDLYLLMGRRDAFEARAMDYSVKFEKSPPTWTDLAKEGSGNALGGGAQAAIVPGAKLDGTAEKAVRQLERVIAANPIARLDLSKIQSADDTGCDLLFAAFKAARKAKCELQLTGAESLIQVLSRLAVAEKREHEPAWLLLLELQQHTGQNEAFEELAVQYAITFEMSPPSWENPPVAKKKAGRPAPEAASPGQHFVLSGEISSGNSELFNRLKEYAKDRDQVVIECTALRRMDFVSAGSFLNALVGLQASGKPAAVRGAHALLTALFNVLGINQFASIERRKL